MKNADNWKLVALLAGLVVIFVGIRAFLSPTLESSLPSSLTEIDSAKVTELIIVPARERAAEIHLIRAGNQWTLKEGERTGRLEQGGITTALASLIRLKPQSIVSKKQGKWNEFSVGDSTGTRVKVLEGSSVESDLWIGRTGFSQSSGGMFAGGGFTYLRLQGQSEVYAVEGFLEGQFNRTFDDWRDKSFTRFKRDSINKISFRYPADSSFVLEKKSGGWMNGAIRADSAAVTSYLSVLEFKNLAAFSAEVPTGEAPAVIRFETDSRIVATIEGWPSLGSWILRSSHQPDTYFSSDRAVIKDIWKGRTEFLKGARKK